MKTNLVCILVCIFTLLFSTTQLLAGGSVIGNGASLAEQEFQFAYYLVGQISKNCNESKDCQLNEFEATLIKKINNVYLENQNNKQRLIFLSELQNPGFFNTGINENHRIAKTGLTAQDPIYINTDLISNPVGKPILDLATMFSILAHEIGHQTGEKNHQLLDMLAVKLKFKVTQKTQTYSHLFKVESKLMHIHILQNNFGFKSSDIAISGSKSATSELNQELYKYLHCQSNQESLAGFEFINGYYFNVNYPTGKKDVIGFGFWLQVYCYNPIDNVTRMQKRDVVFIINEDLIIDTLLISN